MTSNAARIERGVCRLADDVCVVFDRPDKLLQRLVYKAVPGLFHSELQRRKQFYGNPELQNTTRSHGDCRKDLAAMELYYYSAEDLISMSIEYHDRYVTTPAYLTLKHRSRAYVEIYDS